MIDRASKALELKRPSTRGQFTPSIVIVLLFLAWLTLSGYVNAYLMPGGAHLQLMVRLGTLITYIPVFGIAILALGRIALSKRIMASPSSSLNWFLLWLLGLGFVGTVIGFLGGHDALFIVSDAFVLLFIPVMFLIFNQIVPRGGVVLLFFFVVALSVVPSILSVMGQLARVLTGDVGLGGVAILALIIALYFVTSRLNMKPHLRFLIAGLAFIGVIGISLNLSRVTWIMAAVALFTWVIIDGRRSVRVVFFNAAPVLVVLAVFLFVLTPVSSSIGAVLARADPLLHPQQHKYDTAGDYSLSERYRELELVLYRFREEAEVFEWVFGFGYGAEYGYSYNDPFYAALEYKRGTVEGKSHAIHNEFLNIFFRTGFLGLVFYTGAYLTILNVLYRKVKTRNLSPVESVIAKTAFTYFLVRLVGSLSVKMMFDPLLILLVVLVMKIRPEANQSPEPSTAIA